MEGRIGVRIGWVSLALVTMLSAGVSAADIPAAAVADADKIWSTRCSLCHGDGGKGDGPAAATINPKPRTFTDAAWQRSVDDARIETIILKGGTAVNLSALMPANPDLDGKTDVVRALRAKVRGLAAK